MIEKLQDFCDRHQRSMVELAFSWLLSRPTVASVIAGATRPEQVRQNAMAGQWRLTPEQLAELDALAPSP